LPDTRLFIATKLHEAWTTLPLILNSYKSFTISEGLRDIFVSKNLANMKHPIWRKISNDK